jgi:hypothetical protein
VGARVALAGLLEELKQNTPAQEMGSDFFAVTTLRQIGGWNRHNKIENYRARITWSKRSAEKCESIADSNPRVQ